jgi:hypothetical protein
MYYILKPAVDTPETGNAYPAVESYPDYDFNAPNSVHKLNFREFPDFTPDIRFKLAKGAKLCDMMGQATINANGFLISEKLKSIFEKANIVPHKFYPATIEAKGTLHQYYWVHLVWPDGQDYVDFKNTKFNVTEFGAIIEPISINSYSELGEKQKQLGVIKMIYAAQIVMKDPGLDIWPNPINTGIFVSEKTRHQFGLTNPTGVSFEDNNAVLFR